MTVEVSELETILNWCVREIRSKFGDVIDIQYNLYSRPSNMTELFQLPKTIQLNEIGSISDEVDLLRRSIVDRGGEGEFLDIALDRLAFILIALSCSLPVMDYNDAER